MLAIIGASGKLGYATLQALLHDHLFPASSIICTTSGQPGSQQWTKLANHGVKVRHATFDDPASIETALAGCTTLFLVSSPRIALDFNDAQPGSGREKDHKVAIDAARKGKVQHIYYTSLAFANPSKSNVMTAHERTEGYLRSLNDITYTIIREGLYNESWPLYFGYYGIGGDDREVVYVAGDGPISWTAIDDLGLANAMVLAAPREQYAGHTLCLSNTENVKTLREVAGLVSSARGKDVKLQVVSKQEHEDHYVNDRKMVGPAVRWWSATYAALLDEECLIRDRTFQQLLSKAGRKPIPLEDTINKMLKHDS